MPAIDKLYVGFVDGIEIVFNKHIPRIVAHGQKNRSVVFSDKITYKGLTVKGMVVFGKLKLVFQSNIYPPKICFVECRSAKSK
jgi:hypothetical protein